MEIKEYSIKRTILSQIPNLELSNEQIIHQKVHYSKFDYVRVIPKGVRGFLVFKKDRTQNLCYFIETINGRSRDKRDNLYLNFKDYRNRIQVNRIFKYNCVFDDSLVCGRGTILYGTLCDYTNINIKTPAAYFIMENILYLKGVKYVFNGWDKLFEDEYTLITDNIVNNCYVNKQLLVQIPIIQELPVDINALINDLVYNVFCLQYINKDRVEYMFKKANQIQKTYLYVKASLQNDIYEAYDVNNNFIGMCNIPDYKTSIYMNNIYRDIKENDNLDYLEESEDEDEFQDIAEDKYVNLEKKEIFECIYSKRFEMWTPVRLIESYEMEDKQYTLFKCK